jgi:uncharacterized protein
VSRCEPARPKVGIAFRPDMFDEIVRNLALVDVLEVTVEHYLFGSRRVRAMIDELAQRIPIVAHGVTLSLGSVAAPDRAFLARVASFIAAVRAPWYSEHLAFTKTPSHDLSQLMPLVRTPEMIDVVLENLALVETEIPVPVVLENVSYYFQYAASSMSELDFVCAVLARGGCTLLLDVENLRINAANHDFDPIAFVRALPANAVRAVHVAGGTAGGGLELDTHDRPVSAKTLALLDETLRHQAPETIVVERDRDTAGVAGMFDDVRRVRAVVDELCPA